MITIELDGEVWAPCDPGLFFDRPDDAWTPQAAQRWFSDAVPTPRGLARLLGPRHPFSISTALGGGATRYAVRGGLLFPVWSGFSVVDEEQLHGFAPPPGGRLEKLETCIRLYVDGAPAVTLSEPLGIVRCDESGDGVHYYVRGPNRFTREPERHLPASEGADGHL
jgi:hypothetical protein